ncbi:MAG: FprA family A-type flavoprotein [Clostridia bacterium]|nr:FprA family A-type flavoprotein [Clostridia bacterium]
MKISNDIKYIGVNDHLTDLFEGQYKVPNGMSYNSYVIIDEKIAVFDTVDIKFTSEWLDNIRNTIGDKTPDYLIIQHMEPDHSASIEEFLKVYPETVIVTSKKAYAMIGQFFKCQEITNSLIIKEGDTLSLGKHNLTFIEAPMVHWPEVIMTYDAEDKVLFSADGFGKFGALDKEEEWETEAARYYIGIVGKYGVQVQNVLKKAAGLDIKTICPLHGPVLNENLGHYLNLYDTWSSYSAEKDEIVIAYTSIYGNTKMAVELLAKALEAKGQTVQIFDLARDDMALAVSEAFRSTKLVLATTTYNSDIFPFMKTFIHHLTERNYQNRTVGFIENGTWAATAARTMKKMLENSKNLNLAEPTVTIKSAVDETNLEQIKALAEKLCE